jgi:hypothetical protein
VPFTLCVSLRRPAEDESPAEACPGVPESRLVGPDVPDRRFGPHACCPRGVPGDQAQSSAGRTARRPSFPSTPRQPFMRSSFGVDFMASSASRLAATSKASVSTRKRSSNEKSQGWLHNYREVEYLQL